MIEYRLTSNPPIATKRARSIVHGVPSDVGGYAALFNVEAVIAGLFREVIAPGAFAESLRTADGLVRFNHDDNRLLGRTSAGTATVAEDTTGLFYTAAINAHDPLAVSAGAQVQRGDVIGSSFAFDIENADDEEWIAPRGRGDLPLRILYRLTLIDCAPVVRPAYPHTSVNARDGVIALDQARMQLAIARARQRRGLER